MTAIETSIRALLDKQAITELLTGYMRAVDRGDVETLRAAYTDDAVEDHGGVFTGSAADYVDSVAAAITHPRSLTTHLLSNLLIELDGDRATAESYATTFARVWTGSETADSLTAARLIDRLERRDGRWAIAHRTLLWEWNMDVPTSETWVHGFLADDPSVLRKGQKFPADPVYGVTA